MKYNHKEAIFKLDNQNLHVWEAFMTKEFDLVNNNNKLCYYLIEATSIKDMERIGQTIIWCYSVSETDNDKIQRQKVYEDYYKVVSGVKEKNSNIKFSSSLGWYKNYDSFFMFEISNEANNITFFGDLLKNTAQNMRDKDSSNTSFKILYQDLTPVEIKVYLNSYKNELQKADFIKNAKYNYVLVFPMAFAEHNSYKQPEVLTQYRPLGNVYMLIGAQEELKHVDWAGFVARARMVWFYKYGYQLFEELKAQEQVDYDTLFGEIFLKSQKVGKLKEYIQNHKFTMNELFEIKKYCDSLHSSDLVKRFLITHVKLKESVVDHIKRILLNRISLFVESDLEISKVNNELKEINTQNVFSLPKTSALDDFSTLEKATAQRILDEKNKKI